MDFLRMQQNMMENMRFNDFRSRNKSINVVPIKFEGSGE